MVAVTAVVTRRGVSTGRCHATGAPPANKDSGVFRIIADRTPAFLFPLFIKHGGTEAHLT